MQPALPRTRVTAQTASNRLCLSDRLLSEQHRRAGNDTRNHTVSPSHPRGKGNDKQRHVPVDTRGHTLSAGQRGHGAAHPLPLHPRLPRGAAFKRAGPVGPGHQGREADLHCLSDEPGCSRPAAHIGAALQDFLLFPGEQLALWRRPVPAHHGFLLREHVLLSAAAFLHQRRPVSGCGASFLFTFLPHPCLCCLHLHGHLALCCCPHPAPDSAAAVVSPVRGRCHSLPRCSPQARG